MKKYPDSFIPSLREKEKLTEWFKHYPYSSGINLKTIDGDNWIKQGKDTFSEEITDQDIENKLFEFCLERLWTNMGVLVIVSFGGGFMYGMLDLRERLMKKGKELGMDQVDVRIVDYSLTKDLGRKGLEEKEKKSLLTEGYVKLNGGPLELKNIDAMPPADFMFSVLGPFFHAYSLVHTKEMIEKVASRLKKGGQAFFEISFITNSPSNKTLSYWFDGEQKKEFEELMSKKGFTVTFSKTTDRFDTSGYVSIIKST